MAFIHSPPDPSLFAEVDLACETTCMHAMGWDSNMVRKFNVHSFFNDIHSSNWPHFFGRDCMRIGKKPINLCKSCVCVMIMWKRKGCSLKASVYSVLVIYMYNNP